MISEREKNHRLLLKWQRQIENVKIQIENVKIQIDLSLLCYGFVLVFPTS